MKQETLKKIIELADGFAYDDLKKVFNSNGDTYCFFDEIDKWEHYPLLLRRAVEGWNRTNPPIDINGDNLYHFPIGKEMIRLAYYKYEKTEYLTPQEQAIEACLIELLDH